MQNDPVFWWAALVGSVAAFTATKYTIRQKVLEKRRLRRELLVNAYIETGKDYSEVRSLGYGVAASAKRQRSAMLKHRLQEAKSEGFTAVVACPSCTCVDVHYLSKKNERQCNKCGFKWRFK